MDVLYKFLSYTTSRHHARPAEPEDPGTSSQESTSASGSRSTSTQDPLDTPVLSPSEQFAARVRNARESDFPQLRDLIYLDSSASPPFPIRLPQAHTRDLCENLYSNPHSHSASSLSTAKKVEEVREAVMRDLFHLSNGNTGDEGEGEEGWDLVFTSGTTASLKLVGESFFPASSSPSSSAPRPDGPRKREYWVSDQAHTSILGVRDLASASGSKVRVFSMDEVLGGSDGEVEVARSKERPTDREEAKDLVTTRLANEASAGVSRLIGLPAQCNASGKRWSTPETCRRIREDPRFASSRSSEDADSATSSSTTAPDSTYILLDAASYLSPSSTLDLSVIPYAEAPDFVVFSLYKIYGYPTGLGGLLIKRSSGRVLLEGKRYWGGGTLAAITPGSAEGTGWKVPKDDLVQALEDGTINIHGIFGISHGPRAWSGLFGGDMKERARYVRWLTRRMVVGLGALRHGNGEKVVRLYLHSAVGRRWIEQSNQNMQQEEEDEWDHDDADDQGPIVNFNIVHPSGRLVPPTEVDRLACVQNIHLRSGRHCNPGFIVNHLLDGREEEIVDQFMAGMGCDESANAAVVAASLRVSLGVYNTPEDVDTFLTFVKRFWVFEREGIEGGSMGETSPGDTIEGYELSEIRVYPIKSCAGQTIAKDEEWKLTQHGLEFDREWILVDKRTGKGLSQKKYPRMALIKPRIDLERRLLVVQAGDKEISVDLDDDQSDDTMQLASMQICVDTVTPRRSPRYRTIDEMLSDFLSLPCALGRQAGPGRHSKLGGPTTDRVPLLLSNESPFLLLNQHSVDKVSDWITEGGRSGVIVKASSFRGNFVIGRPSKPPGNSAEGAFQEDAVHRFRIGPHTFVPLGACRRCQMVSIDQETGEKAPDTFLTIAKKRRDHRGRILFGTHMMWRDEGNDDTNNDRPIIRVGMKVTMNLAE